MTSAIQQHNDVDWWRKKVDEGSEEGSPQSCENSYDHLPRLLWSSQTNKHSYNQIQEWHQEDINHSIDGEIKDSQMDEVTGD